MLQTAPLASVLGVIGSVLRSASSVESLSTLGVYAACEDLSWRLLQVVVVDVFWMLKSLLYRIYWKCSVLEIYMHPEIRRQNIILCQLVLFQRNASEIFEKSEKTNTVSIIQAVV